MQQKLFLLIISASYLLTGCSHKQNSLRDYNLKGNVIKVYETTYEAENKFGKWEIGEKKYYGNSSMTFNESGYITESISYDRHNKIDEREVVSYDDDNISSGSNVFDSDGKLKSKFIYTKDSKNRIIKTQRYDSEGKIEATYIFEYGSSDKSINGKHINKEGKVESSWKNEWDGDFVKLQLQYDTLGKLESKSYYERNGNGDLTLAKFTNANDSVTSKIKITYEYDNQNNWVKKTVYDTDGKIDAFVTRRIIYEGSTGSKLNSKELIGIWKEVDDNDWIEFKKDGTYDKGYNENIRDIGRWELNEEQKTLTLKSNDADNSKKYSYSYEEQKLILSTIEGKERTEYERR